MAPIEGDTTILDKEQVVLRRGEFRINGEQATFRIEERNPDVHIQVGTLEYHIFSSAAGYVGHVMIGYADIALRITRSILDESGTDYIGGSTSSAVPLYEDEININELLEFEIPNVFTLKIKNTPNS